MRKIRALIVDDEPVARRGLRLYLRDEPDVEIIGECGNGRAALAAIKEQRPDLIFLDVHMPLVDGFGVVQSINSEHAPLVVFVTAYDEHALRAFETGAFDYLLKPYDQERLRKTLMRARVRLKHPNKDEYVRHLISALDALQAEGKIREEKPKPLERVVIKEAGRIFFLSVEEIDWVKSEGNYVRLHVAGESHLLRETMDAMEAKLDPDAFVRIRRSALVRLNHISELQPLFNGEFVVILKNGTRLTSSRRYRKNLDRFLGA